MSTFPSLSIVVDNLNQNVDVTHNDFINEIA